jgi:ketosteroid isomerase-like protein
MPFLRLLVVLWAMTTPACASQGHPNEDAASESEGAIVLAAEDAYVAAEVSRDEAALRRLVDEKFVYNSAGGVTSGKEELIRNILGLNMTGQTISERSVVLEGGMAVILGTAELVFQDPGQPPRISRLRYTSVWVKRDEGWRMFALQMQARSAQ